MRTQKKLNRPIKFWGLSSGQFGLFCLAIALIIIVCIFLRLPSIITVMIIGAIAFLSNLFFKNLIREHKAGNPDYSTSQTVKTATPRKIIDRYKVFNLILK